MTRESRKNGFECLSHFQQSPEHAFLGLEKREPKIGQWSWGEKIGQHTVQVDFLKLCLQHIEEQQMLQP